MISSVKKSKILIAKHRFDKTQVVYENIKAAASGIGKSESTLKKKLCSGDRIYMNDVWRIEWVDFVNHKRKERSDKDKRVEQMKRINLAKATEQIKKHGKIIMNDVGRAKFTQEFLKPQSVEKVENNSVYYDTVSADKDDYNQDIPTYSTKEDKLSAARKAMIIKNKK